MSSIVTSARARLALRTSAVALCGAMLAGGSLASAQETKAEEQAQIPANPDVPVSSSQNPSNTTSAPTSTSVGPTTNPTAKAAAQSTSVNTEPTPGPDSQTPTQPAVAPQSESNGIVVTGIRASLASAARIKRNSVLIVDSVSAEDIGKLPDVSIADSLARLPGVTAQRLEGRDQRLSIRGLGPDFSTTLLNGREQVTSGDNRGVEYDQYPSEFFKNVNVYKSADASLIAAGISGTVDLRQLRPLDQPKRVFVVSARGQMNGIKSLNPDVSRYGWRASATYVDQFADDTLGIAIGLSGTRAPSQDERYNAWGYAGSGTAADPYVLGGAKPYVQSNVLKRYGGVATIEWKPSEKFHSTFDALYTHFEENQVLRGIEFPMAFNGDSIITRGAVVNGLVTQATVIPPYTVQRNDTNRRKADQFSLGWNNNYNFTETLHLNVDASWSHSKRRDFLLETYSGTGYRGSGLKDNLTINQQKDGTFTIVPTINYTDTNIIKITDPGGWGYNGTQAVVQAGFLNKPSFKDDLKSLRGALSGDIDGSLVKGWEIGGNYTRRKKTSKFTSFFLCPKGGGTNCTVASGTPQSVPVPADAVLDKQVSLGYLGVPAMLTLDPLYLYNNIYNAVYDNRPVSLVRDFSVLENVWTGYAKVNFDGELGEKSFKGNIGVQVVHTRQGSKGSTSSFTNGVVTVVPLSDRVTYTDVLPSATIAVELLRATYLKIGASQTMVRPRLDQERINSEITINQQNVSAPNPPPFYRNSAFGFTGGNYRLRPYQSTNIDLSFEKYFPAGGYVALAGYFKNLTKFVNPAAATLYDFTPYLGLFSPTDQATIVANGGQIGVVQQPQNNGRGYLEGVEATLSLPFKMITPALDGFGMFVSGSYTLSSIKLGDNPISITLPGASKYVGSATVFFEKWGFQARANFRYRSKFLAEVAGLSANPEFRTAKSEGILDAQIGYEFQDGPLKNFSILLQGKNLTDRPFVTYDRNDPRLVRDYQRYGRDYFVGVTYKF